MQLLAGLKSALPWVSGLGFVLGGVLAFARQGGEIEVVRAETSALRESVEAKSVSQTTLQAERHLEVKSDLAEIKDAVRAMSVEQKALRSDVDKVGEDMYLVCTRTGNRCRWRR